jgi:hypothetical protein
VVGYNKHNNDLSGNFLTISFPRWSWVLHVVVKGKCSNMDKRAIFTEKFEMEIYRSCCGNCVVAISVFTWFWYLRSVIFSIYQVLKKKLYYNQ